MAIKTPLLLVCIGAASNSECDLSVGKLIINFVLFPLQLNQCSRFCLHVYREGQSHHTDTFLLKDGASTLRLVQTGIQVKRLSVESSLPWGGNVVVH